MHLSSAIVLLVGASMAIATPSHIKHRKRCSGHKKTSTSVSAAQTDDYAQNNVQGSGSKASTSVAWSGSSTSSSQGAISTAKLAATGSSSNSGAKNWGLSGLNVNQIHFGIIPDDGSGRGQAQTMTQLNAIVGSNIPAQGWYAQARSGTPFDGNQFLWRKDQIVKAGGVFQPAVMPTGGWQGLTYNDNSQAVRICKVMKEFTDAGLEVWLRFAHEINWYLQDGTYSGSKEDFKEGWDVVAKACRQIAPSVKMWYTPNVASLDVYDAFFPDDVSTVDLIGIDYYARDLSAGSDAFIQHMKGFHDKYCNDNIKFAIGEIGLMVETSLENQLKYAKSITNQQVATAMPHFFQMTWFNLDKEVDFRILGRQGDWATKAWLTGSS